MRKLFLIIVFVAGFVASNSQVQETWAISHIRSSLYDQVVDAAGNVYVTGDGFSEGLDEGGILTFKYDKNGNEIWRNFFVGSYDTKAITIDASGNVYIAAEYRAGTENHYFVLKLNATGHYVWSNVYFEDDVVGIPTSIAVDENGDVYVTGVSYAIYVSGIPSSADYATVKYNGIDGEEVWVRRYNGASPNNEFDGANSMVLDAVGNIYVTGTSYWNGQSDIVTIKYSPTGTVLWAQRFDDGGLNDSGADVKLDAAGNVLIAGSIGSSSGFSFDIRLIKYTFTGFQLWTRRVYNNLNGARRAIKVVIDNSGNPIVLAEGHHAIVVKHNAAGDQLWIKELGDLGGRQADVATDGANIYLAAGGTGGLTTVKLNSNGDEQWRKAREAIFNDITLDRIGVDANQNVYSSTSLPYLTIRYSQCTLTCPGNVSTNSETGKCGATVNYSSATIIGDCGSTINYSHPSGSFFPVGVTTVTVTSTETGATCSFTITVNDVQNPIITSCPSNKTVNTGANVCYATAASISPGTALATDNCSYDVLGTRSDGLALTANYPVGNTIIKWTATDASNNTATCSQTITVIDNVPPTISGEAASIYVLSPANHTMRDVAIDYTATDNCTATATISITSNEPVNGTGDGDTDPDWIVTDNHHVQLRAERSANGEGRIYTIKITATDASGNTAAKILQVRVPHNIKNPHSGKAFIVGSTVNFEGEFWDKAGNKHTAKWVIDDNTIAKATVTEPSGGKNGKVTGSYKFTAPGVYKLQMNITDQTGLTTYTNTAGDLEAIVVIFDPNGGNAYGGGYFNSPVGALRSNLSASGKASYGFAMNYFKNSTYPKGETQFEFKIGSFEFNALNFEYFVIGNSMAQLKGTGKIIGGQSGLGFTMTVTDGQLDGSGVDKIRMKIYNKNNGSIIYDNQPGASDAALPTQAVGANSIIVIGGTNATQSSITQKAEMEAIPGKVSVGLDVLAYPNPSANDFSVTVQTNAQEKIMMQVIDMYGRVVEIKNVTANSLVKFGNSYRPGTYFIRVMQGKQHKELKLIKLSD